LLARRDPLTVLALAVALAFVFNALAVRLAADPGQVVRGRYVTPPPPQLGTRDRLLPPLGRSRQFDGRRYLLGTDSAGRDYLEVLRTTAGFSTAYWLEIAVLAILPATLLGHAAAGGRGRAGLPLRGLVHALRLVDVSPPLLILIWPIILIPLVGIAARVGHSPFGLIQASALGIAATFWHRIALATWRSIPATEDLSAPDLGRRPGATALQLAACASLLLATVIPIDAMLRFMTGPSSTLIGAVQVNRQYWLDFPHLWWPAVILIALAVWSVDRLGRVALELMWEREHPGALPVARAFPFLAFDFVMRDAIRARRAAATAAAEVDVLDAHSGRGR
jgi:ABC-type dipeptide/oligopeptide/nickel transport system permease subunit